MFLRRVSLILLFFPLLLSCSIGSTAKVYSEHEGTVMVESEGEETPVTGSEQDVADNEDDWREEDEYNEVVVADPIEPLNRLAFHFNDKLYFWLLKPLAETYRFVTPKPVRKSVGNFFYNLKMPIRFTNNVLQGKFSASGFEVARFLVNSTIGVLGLWDPARNWLDLSPSEEDFGQTLGKYGVGEGFYICWPIFGPSNVRDTLGLAGDYFLDPVSYLGFNGENSESFAVKSGETINRTALGLGNYEDFKNATFDPYLAMRDAYFHSRRSKINDEDKN